jgi:ribosomal protein L40E
MSSGTSTESAAVPAAVPDHARRETGPPKGGRRAEPFEPWQLFTLAGLIGATIVVFFARGQSPAAVIVLSLIVFAAAAVGVAALRMVAPLTGQRFADASQGLSARAREALERDKALVLRSIKELEFDHAMGKVSDGDDEEMRLRLRARAADLLRQLDAGAGYRELIEREIELRAGTLAHTPPPAAPAAVVVTSAEPQVCAACEIRNDADARFCKSCGAGLRPQA